MACQAVGQSGHCRLAGGKRQRVDTGKLDQRHLRRTPHLEVARRSGLLPVQLVWPRGRVRRLDLDTYRVGVSADFATPGKLVFKVGQKELAASPFDPESLETIEPLPASVLDAIRPGATVAWGFVPTACKSVWAEFTLVGDSDEKVTWLQDTLPKASSRPAPVQRWLEVHGLFAADLPFAAYRALSDMVETSGLSVQRVQMQIEALRRMIPDAAKQLPKMRVWVQAARTIRRLERDEG